MSFSLDKKLNAMLDTIHKINEKMDTIRKPLIATKKEIFDFLEKTTISTSHAEVVMVREPFLSHLDIKTP